MIINAENTILGRMASAAAKHAAQGEEVVIVNCEKAIVKNPDSTTKRYLELMDIGQPQQGPYIHRRADMFVRRVVRGMLPYKKAKGKKAYSQVTCFIGVPDHLSKEKMEVFGTPITKGKTITVGQLCSSIGAK